MSHKRVVPQVLCWVMRELKSLLERFACTQKRPLLLRSLLSTQSLKSKGLLLERFAFKNARIPSRACGNIGLFL